MKYYFEKITDHVYGFLLWDESWNSYNNCYLVMGDNGYTLIDSGKEEHFDYLETSLAEINLKKDEIFAFIATHGHKDHIGGLSFLENIKSYIHSEDLSLVPENLKTNLTGTLPDNGEAINGLEYIFLGHHTPGSVALFHQESGVLFCGDHLCFFGEPLPNEKVAGNGKEMKDKYVKFISEWAKNEEMRSKHHFELFMQGLKKLREIRPSILCTGHGVVIKDDVDSFLSDLIQGHFV
ncbi:MBL fold metallo-hydrolase [Sutcliffiella horikoshii]|uniref:MBL fold metallo-hydrolase n=1 Tax=Sutcliffiella horikoshii TaxID=79883 RepID=UPI002040691B|nr:MBL fold metallo-hydrolase [Sutcliffiella horikoshii]MCM3617659.1 MBL fold metallo-hydrolase [Sutcliffiella horikoshii]